jgi:hypothetical protein
VSVQDLVDVQISVTSAGPSRPGFGTALIAAYHTAWGAARDLARVYTDMVGVAADGFDVAHPAYQMANAMFSQDPRPPQVKIGKRALAFTQVVELTPEAPATGKVYALTVNGAAVSYTALNTDNLAAVCTALASAISTAGGAAAGAILTGGASSASPQTITSFNGTIGGRLMSPPRAPSVTFSSSADWHATTGTVTGKDRFGQTISQALAIPNGGGATVNLSPLFAQITEIDIPAQGGTGGTFTVGVQKRVAGDGSSTTKVVCTATTAGELVDYSALSPTLTLFDATTDPGIATDLAAIRAFDADWYGLEIDGNSKPQTLAAAAWAEPFGILFGAQSADSACKDAGSTTDVLAVLQADAYTHTDAWFHPSVATPDAWLAAGMTGDRFPDDPGSDTWAYKTLAGVAPYALTASERAALLAKNANIYTLEAGVGTSFPGKVASGEWVDVIRFLDWLKANLRLDVFALLLANKKVPFTDKGIDLVKGVVRARLNAGVEAGGIDGAAPTTVSAPRAKDVSPANKRNRLLPGVQFACTLAGAIHTVQVRGTVTE